MSPGDAKRARAFATDFGLKGIPWGRYEKEAVAGDEAHRRGLIAVPRPENRSARLLSPSTRAGLGLFQVHQEDLAHFRGENFLHLINQQQAREDLPLQLGPVMSRKALPITGPGKQEGKGAPRGLSSRGRKTQRLIFFPQDLQLHECWALSLDVPHRVSNVTADQLEPFHQMRPQAKGKLKRTVKAAVSPHFVTAARIRELLIDEALTSFFAWMRSSFSDVGLLHNRSSKLIASLRV